MEYRRFLTYNVVGGIGWVASMSWAGYLLGQAVPNISKHMHVLVIVIIVLSCIPIAVEVYRERRKSPTRS
jgi:membrane-associated protein